MKKKILAAALAMTMMLGSSVGVLASGTPNVTAPDDSGAYSSELEISSAVKAPDIKVTVPTTLTIGINPYKLQFDHDGDSNTPDSTEQIVCADQTIENKSDVAISVGIASLGAEKETTSNLVLSATAPAAAVKTKAAFLYFQATTEADFPEFSAKDPGTLVVPVTKTAAKADVMKLDATTGTGKFRIAGSVATNPTVAWTADDTATIKLKFTFTPLVVEE